MKLADAVSIAHAQRNALETKAEEVIAEIDDRLSFTPDEVRELAELAVSAAHHWKLESPERSASDVVGSTIGYALLGAALLVIAAIVVAAWRWALG